MKEALPKLPQLNASHKKTSWVSPNHPLQEVPQKLHRLRTQVPQPANTPRREGAELHPRKFKVGNAKKTNKQTVHKRTHAHTHTYNAA